MSKNCIRRSLCNELDEVVKKILLDNPSAHDSLEDLVRRTLWISQSRRYQNIYLQAIRRTLKIEHIRRYKYLLLVR